MNCALRRIIARRIVPSAVLIGILLLLGCTQPATPTTPSKPKPSATPTTEALSLTAALAVPPDDQRPTVLAEMGPPDAFTLHFDELEGQAVRWETWSYFDFGTRFDFIDGELLWTAELAPVPDGSIYAHFYDPAEFQAGMTIAQVKDILVLKGQALQEIDLGTVDLEGGVALAGDQILLGFQDDRLLFVETVILSPDAAGEPLAPPPVYPLLEDDFSQPLRAEPLFPPERMVLDVVDGQGRFTTYALEGYMVAVYPGLVMADFVADVQIAAGGLSSGSDAGLYFRGDPTLNDQFFYYIGIGGPPYYELRLNGWSAAMESWVVDEAELPESLITEDGVYTLRIEAQGASFRVSVNETFVTEFSDTTIGEAGIFGLAMIASEPPETAFFDNLAVYPLP